MLASLLTVLLALRPKTGTKSENCVNMYKFYSHSTVLIDIHNKLVIQQMSVLQD
jgi:hypothetical protein